MQNFTAVRKCYIIIHDLAISLVLPRSGTIRNSLKSFLLRGAHGLARLCNSQSLQSSHTWFTRLSHFITKEGLANETIPFFDLFYNDTQKQNSCKTRKPGTLTMWMALGGCEVVNIEYSTSIPATNLYSIPCTLTHTHAHTHTPFLTVLKVTHARCVTRWSKLMQSRTQARKCNSMPTGNYIRERPKEHINN